jgi:lactoylglutathione lyase
MTIDLRVDHISLCVHDLAVSAQFYSEILGLREIENKTRRPEIRWFAFDGGRAVHLIARSGEKAPAFEEAVRFLKEKAISFVNSSGEVGQIGFRADGVRQIYFQDPDNYWIEVCDA